MRLFEILTVLCAVATLIWASFAATAAPVSVAARSLAVLSLVLAVAQVAVEGYRWQMLPLYALAAGLVPLAWLASEAGWPSRLSTLLPVWGVAALLVAATLGAAGYVHPVFRFVPLTGRLPVGVRSFALRDTSRLDPYAATPGAARELMVEVWYPAADSPALPLAPYRDGRQNGRADAALALVRTRSHADAPVARGGHPYPVLLFSGPFNRFQNTYETEDLASHGYIVIGIDHPYDSDQVNFPDGRVLRARKANTFLDFSSAAAYVASERDVQSDLAVRSADVEQVLDAVQHWQIDPAHPLFGRLDLSRIGMFGHSFGGAVTAEVCRRDRRLRAGVNMDGWMFGESQKAGVQQPFFFMSDDTPRPSPADLQVSDGPDRRMALRTEQGYEEIENSLDRYGGYYLQVPGLEHMNFSDTPLYSRVKATTGAGRIDARRAHAMVLQFTLAFFDRWLRDGSDDAIAAVHARFPEATFKVVDRSSTSAQAPHAPFLAAGSSVGGA